MAGNNLGTAHGAIKIDTSDLKNADIALRSAGTSMIGFGLVAVGAFGAIVAEAAKFEKEMDFVQAVTGASADEMQKLQDKAIELGKESIFGPVALSQAFVDLAKAGADVQDIIDGVGEASVQLATAADVEIPFAGENLINIMNTFSLGAEDAVRVADLLAGAANASSVELSDIVTTMRYAGPVAAAMGVSLEDVNDALSVLGLVGIKGSTAGTSLRFMMARLVPDTDKAKDAIEGLGLTIGEDGLVKEFSNADGSIRDLASIMQVLQDATKDMNDQAKIAVINDIFGVRAMPSVLALMEAGADGFAEVNARINETTAADVAAKRMDNLDGSLKRLKATLSAIMVEAGGPFQETVKGWVDALRDLLLAFDSLPDPIKTFLISAVLVIGVMSLMSGAFLLTIGNIVRAVRVFGEITNAMYLLARGMRTAATANGILSASFLASPIFWVILLILLLVAAFVILWIKCEAFREFWKGLWEDIKGILSDVGEFFTTLWDDISGFFANWEEHWEKAKVAVGDAWEAIKGFFGDMGSTIGGFFSGIGSAIGGFFSDIGSFISDDIWGPFADSVEDAASAVGEFFGSLPSRASGALTDLVTGFINNIGELPGAIGYALGFAIGRIIRFGIDANRFFQGLFARIRETVVRWGVNMVYAVAGFLADLWTGFLSWGEDVLSWGYEFGGNLVDTIIGWIQQLPMLVISHFIALMAHLVTWGIQAWNWATQMASDIFWAIVNGLIDLPGQVIGFFETILSWLWGAAGDFFSAAWDIGNDIFNGIIDFVMGIPGEIENFINNGIDILRNLAGNAASAARDFGSGIWEGFKDGLGINSPSYVERALMAIEDQAKDTNGNLARSLKSMNGLSATIPVNSGALGISTPSSRALVGAGVQHHYHAPLVGEAEIRDRRDIYELAGDLEYEQSRKNRGRGI